MKAMPPSGRSAPASVLAGKVQNTGCTAMETGRRWAQRGHTQQGAGETHRCSHAHGSHHQRQAGDTARLACSLGMAGNPPGGQQRAQPGNGRDHAHQQAHLGAQQARHLAGQIEHHAIDAGLDQQVDQRQVEHARLAYRGQQAVAVGRPWRALRCRGCPAAAPCPRG